MRSPNPRRANGSKRSSVVRWLRRQGRPCWICRMPIDYGAPCGDPLSFECDELVPVSHGGSPYERSNVDAAHRCCNNWRKAKPVRRVAELRAMALAAFGAWSSPEQFVLMAKEVERNPKAGKSMTPPRTTTDW